MVTDVVTDDVAQFAWVASVGGFDCVYHLQADHGRRLFHFAYRFDVDDGDLFLFPVEGGPIDGVVFREPFGEVVIGYASEDECCLVFDVFGSAAREVHTDGAGVASAQGPCPVVDAAQYELVDPLRWSKSNLPGIGCVSSCRMHW